MKSLGTGVVVCAVAILAGVLTTACSSHYVVVPRPDDGYRATDTLYGWLHDDEIRVTFRFDTIVGVDTVVRVDTLWRAGSRTLVRVDTVVRTDTVRIPVPLRGTRVDTVVRTDTVRIRGPFRGTRVDTILRVDTVRVAVTDTVVRVDTVRLAVTDTVRVPGQRVLFVPPGHYPPAGQCRVWVHDLPPGRQARPAPCDALGAIPAGAFILFGGEAWDFDYDWLAVAAVDPGAVPPEIVALKRKG